MVTEIPLLGNLLAGREIYRHGRMFKGNARTNRAMGKAYRLTEWNFRGEVRARLGRMGARQWRSNTRSEMGLFLQLEEDNVVVPCNIIWDES